MKKLLFVFGTRPEAIKMLPIIRLARQCYADKFSVKVCITGQHREMLDNVLHLFDVISDYDLNVMVHDQKMEEITAKILLGLHPILLNAEPDCVLVQGDTSTTLSASLAAYYQRIPVAHIEAGLRTHDIYDPWPEEINRKVVGSIAKFHFVPTEISKNNLYAENIKNNVVVVGNSVIDALLFTIDKIYNDRKMNKELKYSFEARGVNFNKKIILITAHRRESFGDNFISICKAIKTTALLFPDIQLVYPVHLNPRVRKTAYEMLMNISNIVLMEPQNYQAFVFLMQKAFFILTDSGGIQEEAASLKKPLLVMRNVTERPEVVNEGNAKIIGTNSDKIVDSVKELLTDSEIYESMTKHQTIYGTGKTSQLILDYLSEKLC